MSQIDLKLTHQFPKDFNDAAALFPKAAAASLNKVANSARAEISRQLRSTYEIKGRDITKYMTISGANKNTLTARIRMSGSALALQLFGARQVGSGVSIAVKVGERKILRGAFIAEMKSGHVGVFKRTGTFKVRSKQAKPRWQGKLLETIKEYYTIGLAQMFSSRKLREDLTLYVGEHLPLEFERTIRAFQSMGRE